MAAPSKTWNIQNYILAALGGTLAATAIVIMVSAIFRPARISFFVTHATRSTLSGGDGVWLNLTVSANTSGQRRTQVKYESIFIDLVNSTKPTATDKVHAVVTAWPEDYLPSPSLISVDASALLIDNSTIEGFAGNLSNIIRGLTVVVMAQVHFRVGVVPTRLYGIKMFCGGVHFTDDQDSSDATVDCHS
ncbi:hypothetical protein PAHAL_3G437800 [Panicum hallii]|jgi:hypothetical protein|uniref:Late embryogenesis abundant protein LEA-2 subgroup domain-containing protein n=1 Tax=Panicum hallii TaxID=206008 RepID=A0A2S3HE27_9POAL|nr:uncharacterized protein LOC112887138 [Panicum hallii]PAN21076.1 hypothetical protein PAHAL_3G437800 [Panicum hallii]